MSTSTSSVIVPVVVTLATPAILSSSGSTCSVTKSVTSVSFIPSTSTAATITGIMSGFNFMMMDLPTESSQYELIWSRFSRISIVVESILAVSSNSRITSEMFSWDMELTFSILVTVAMDCSIGFVTTVSTVSGLAPWYVVITIAYGRSMLGRRSVFIFVNETTPRIRTNTTATTTVYGFFTLKRASILFSSFFSLALECAIS